MSDETTIREWVDNYKQGKYSANDYHTQVKAGWYDWFCRDTLLASRLKKFGSILKKVKNEKILDNYRVWFKNNCPCVGPLYDDMRFEPLDESKRGTEYFLISVNDKRMDAKYCVYTARNQYKCELKTDTLAEAVDFINKF